MRTTAKAYMAGGALLAALCNPSMILAEENGPSGCEMVVRLLADKAGDVVSHEAVAQVEALRGRLSFWKSLSISLSGLQIEVSVPPASNSISIAIPIAIAKALLNRAPLGEALRGRDAVCSGDVIALAAEVDGERQRVGCRRIFQGGIVMGSRGGPESVGERNQYAKGLQHGTNITH